MFPAALTKLPLSRSRSALPIHTFVFRATTRTRRKMLATLDGMRQQAGFAGLPALDAPGPPTTASSRPALPHSDDAPLPGWEMVRHAGPVLEIRYGACRTHASALARDRHHAPRTGQFLYWICKQRLVDKVLFPLDALAELRPGSSSRPSGGIAGPEQSCSVRWPPSCAAHRCADPIIRAAAMYHDPWRPRHSDALAPPRRVPMVVIPGLVGDQPFVAAAVAGVRRRHCPAGRCQFCRDGRGAQILGTPSFTEERSPRHARRASTAQRTPPMRWLLTNPGEVSLPALRSPLFLASTMPAGRLNRAACANEWAHHGERPSCVFWPQFLQPSPGSAVGPRYGRSRTITRAKNAAREFEPAGMAPLPSLFGGAFVTAW